MREKILLFGLGKNAGLELVRLLSGMGYQSAAVPWSAFSPRNFGRDRPGLIIADCERPAAPALDAVCAQVRKLWGELFPVIAVSSSSRFRDVAALLDAGATDCLSVNATAGLIERKVSGCLRRSTPPTASELTEEVPDILLRIFGGNPNLVRLGDLVAVHAGATPRRPAFRRMAPPDPDWRGAMTSAAVDRFHAGKPDVFLRWSRLHLFRLPPPGEYSVPEKVLLRRAGPPLAAAVDRSRSPAGTDVYSLVPREGIGAAYVACILNSRLMDFYFNRLAGTGADGRLRPDVIRDTPVPRPTAAAMQDAARTYALLAHFGPNPQIWIDRQSKEELDAHLEESVFRLYGMDREAREGLEALHF